MKRTIALCLAVLLLIPACTACTTSIVSPRQMVNPAMFYYRRATVTYGTADGVIGIQTVDLGPTAPELEAFLQRYFEELPEEGLESPFPNDYRVISVAEANNTVTVQLGGAYAELSGIQATIADACLAKTLLAYTHAEKVLLYVFDANDQTLRSKKIAESDILLFDDSSDTSSTSFTLFFTDENERYLISERRTVPYMTASELPKYVVNRLIEGPETNGLQKILPNGTRLLDINVDNGVCAVDFSADFLNNRPRTVIQERLALLSIVNSLSELDNIEQVQFYVEGRRQELFSFLSINESFVTDMTAVGPVRSDLNEQDATVYLPVAGNMLLYAIPVRLKTGSGTAAEAVLRLLSDYEPKNGLLNPLFGAPLPQSIQINGRCCTLNYPEGTTFGDSPETELSAIRIITASMIALDDITSVTVLIDGAPAEFRFNELPEVLQTNPDWYCVEAEELNP